MYIVHNNKKKPKQLQSNESRPDYYGPYKKGLQEVSLSLERILKPVHTIHMATIEKESNHLTSKSNNSLK